MCLFAHYACRLDSQIRLACYEALVRTAIWPELFATVMLSRISESDAKEKKEREEAN